MTSIYGKGNGRFSINLTSFFDVLLMLKTHYSNIYKLKPFNPKLYPLVVGICCMAFQLVDVSAVLWVERLEIWMTAINSFDPWRKEKEKTGG